MQYMLNVPRVNRLHSMEFGYVSNGSIENYECRVAMNTGNMLNAASCARRL